MAITINVNGESISYPQTGDPNWSDEATDFAEQTASAFGKLGLDIGTSVDIPQTLDVTGATTLDSTLTVAGTTTLNGTANLNGNTNLGNATTDIVAVTAILNVDAGVLYVDPATNKVGINDTTPSVELDVNGSVAITGNETVGGTLGVTGNSTFTGDVITSIVKASGSGGLTIDSNGGTDVALFGAGGGSGTTLYGGLNGTTGNFTTGISVGDGSASSPSIAPTSDTDSGLYSIGSNKIGLAANGTRVGEFGDGYGGFTGNIIQVLSTAKTDTSTFSTSFGTISGLSQSITPRYLTSKILIIININFGRTGDNILYFKLLRGSTDIYIGDAAGSRTRVSASNYMSNISTGIQTGNITLVFLDSPSSVSSVTYNTQGRVDLGSGFINRAGTDTDNTSYMRMASSITVMELQQ